MTIEDTNKAIVGRWFTSFWGKTCDLSIVDERAAPDMLLHYSLHDARRGRDDIKAFMTDFRAAFPDLNFWGAADLIAEGEYVVGRWEGGGTHTATGELGEEPSGIDELGEASHAARRSRAEREGAGEMGAREIVERIEAEGGSINAATGYERTSFEVRALHGSLPLAMQVISDLVFRPTLDSDEIEREKDVVAQEIAEAFVIIEQIIAAGQAAGVLRDDIAARLVSFVFWGAIDEVLTGWVFGTLDGDDEAVATAERAVVEVVLHGLAAPRG